MNLSRCKQDSRDGCYRSPCLGTVQNFGQRAVHGFASPPQEAINTGLVWPRGQCPRVVGNTELVRHQQLGTRRLFAAGESSEQLSAHAFFGIEAGGMLPPRSHSDQFHPHLFRAGNDLATIPGLWQRLATMV